jgi:DNA-binding response OmpR family regulator
MTQTKTSTSRRVLLVDDDPDLRDVMSVTLESKGFEIISAATVTEGLKFITTQRFDALITDLHMPNPTDGFAVVTAMRHTQPDAFTLLISGYPDVKSAVNELLLEADDIIMKPFEVGKLAQLIQDKLLLRRNPSLETTKERAAAILQRCSSGIIEEWLGRVKKNKELNQIALTDHERTGCLPGMIEDLIVRLREPNVALPKSDSVSSEAAAAHGKMRKLQGYSPVMLLHDSRILQIALFGTLQNHLGSLDFSLLLPDVMTIADEVDLQLTQALDSYTGVALESGTA